MVLFIFTDVTFTTGNCDRSMHIALGIGGDDLRGILSRVRGRSRFRFFCGGGRISVSQGIAVGDGRGRVDRILGRLFTKAGVKCGVLRGDVVLSPGRVLRAATTRRRAAGGVGKLIASRAKSPIVKTGVGRGRAKGKAVASVGNGFDLSMKAGDAVVVSCVKCVAGRIPMNGGASLAIRLTRGAGRLSRIIIATLNVGHRRGTLNCTIRGMSNSGLTTIGAMGMTASLANGVTKLGMGGDARFGASPSLSLHTSTPLLIVSKIPCNGMKLGSVTTSSVRSISILGKTATSTLCNTHKKTNTIVVAAGGKGRRKLGIAIGDDAVFTTKCLEGPRIRASCDSKSRNACSAKKCM